MGADETDREAWLHGWRRMGRTVLMGTSLFCAGCGRDEGILTVVYPPGVTFPDQAPAWPFPEVSCPVHLDRDELPMTREDLVDALINLRARLKDLIDGGLDASPLSEAL